MTTNRIDYRLTAGLLMAHALILAIGFNILAVVFEFPDVLRMSADYRLTLFATNRSIIIPTYYALAFTGLTQVAISVLLHRLLADRRDGLLALATTFGVLTGLFQVLGFIRWVVLIPYLASGLQDPASGVDPATIIFLEGFVNRYLGMTVGEHLGFLAQGIWAALLGIVLLRTQLFDRSLALVTLLLGLLFLPLSLEPLGSAFAPLEILSLPVNGGWLILLFVMAISLLRTDVRTGHGIRLGWRAWAMAGVAFALAVLPGMIG